MSEQLIKYLSKRLVVNFSNELIGKLNFFYSLKGKERSNFYLVFTNVEEVDILGLILLYKFLEYSVLNNCFREPVLYNFDSNSILRQKIEFFGFRDIINELKKNKTSDAAYSNLRVDVKEDFIIAPMPLLRQNGPNNYLNNTYSKKIISYYSNDRIASMIFCVFSEVFLNFWSHAVSDEKTVIVAHGNNKYVEIVCADSGIGIINSIVEAYPKCKKKDAIKLAIQKDVSSKRNTNHMGYGLWLINEIVTRTGGRMIIHSDSYEYENRSGNIRFFDAPFWQGTVIYIKLFLENPVTIEDIERNNSKLLDLKINFQ